MEKKQERTMTKSYNNLIRIKKSGIKEFGLYSLWRYETYKLCTETEQKKYVKLYPERSCQQETYSLIHQEK